jgi:serine/threonine protein kinase
MRRKSNTSNEAEAADNSVSLEPYTSEDNGEENKYQFLEPDAEEAISEKHNPPATKSWEINYTELKILETVGEGAFGTVHRAIYRHQQVAVKQLKNQIDQREVWIHSY